MEIKKAIEERSRYRRSTILIILISFVIKGIVAGTTNLGNDEVYYILYALFPDWSHFDHPPMVGYIIQLFSLDLLLRSEFFIRLGAIVLSSFSTWIIYLLTEKISSPRGGFFAALIFTASVYATIIAGTFILPDAPQMLFWLAAMYYFHGAVLSDPKSEGVDQKILLAGLFAGLGMLSKYTAAYLWVGAGAYILLFNRKWLKKLSLWLSGIISLVIFSPVIFWNINNDFISFTFQGSRATFSNINPGFLGVELLGEFMYNNPVVFILIIITIVMLLRGKSFCDKGSQRYLLLMSIPMILLFWVIALSRRTLPHWTGPAFFPLIMLTACRFDRSLQKGDRNIPKGIRTALIVLAGFLFVAWLQIKTGFIPLEQNNIPDPTCDLYGWENMGEQYKDIHDRAVSENLIAADAPIVSHRWYPAANYEYYLAYDAGTTVMGLNKPSQTHKYAWINAERGDFMLGMDAWAIESSRDKFKPQKWYRDLFSEIYCYDTIIVKRSGVAIDTGYVYICKTMKRIPDWNQTIRKDLLPTIFFGSTIRSKSSDESNPSFKAASFRVIFSS